MKVDDKQLPVGWIVSTIEGVADVNPRLNKADIDDNLYVSFIPMPAVGAAEGSIDVREERPFVEVKKKDSLHLNKVMFCSLKLRRVWKMTKSLSRPK